MSAPTRTRLGRGLAALLNETPSREPVTVATPNTRKLPIEQLRSNPQNPRKSFNEQELEGLSISIRSRGLIQPIIVRRVEDDDSLHEIVAGERRWRAAQRAGLHEVDVIVMSLTDSESLELALVENLQRSDLNPIEEAESYRALINQHKYTQEDVSTIIGKSRSHVANTMRLLTLPQHTRGLIESGALTAGHARALVTLEDPNALADKIVKNGLTVRSVERLVNTSRNVRKDRNDSVAAFDHDIESWQARLSEALGMKVSLKLSGEKGEVRIAFMSLDELNSLSAKLCSGLEIALT